MPVFPFGFLIYIIRNGHWPNIVDSKQDAEASSDDLDILTLSNAPCLKNISAGGITDWFDRDQLHTRLVHDF